MMRPISCPNRLTAAATTATKEVTTIRFRTVNVISAALLGAFTPFNETRKTRPFSTPIGVLIDYGDPAVFIRYNPVRLPVT